jgi:rhodanese-related sulfurtransferase
MVIRRRLSLVALAALATAGGLVLTGCGGGGSSSAPPSRLVSPAEFARVVAAPGVKTLNVLGPGAPTIAGTDLAMPAADLKADAAQLPATSTRLAVYCWSGHTSARAVRTLHDLGYERIVELRGGMLAWQAAGLPLHTPGLRT